MGRMMAGVMGILALTLVQVQPVFAAGQTYDAQKEQEKASVKDAKQGKEDARQEFERREADAKRQREQLEAQSKLQKEQMDAQYRDRKEDMQGQAEEKTEDLDAKFQQQQRQLDSKIDARQVFGTITSINHAAGQLALKEEGVPSPAAGVAVAPSINMVLDRNTAVMSGSQALKLQDLHVGDRVKVTFTTQQGKHMVQAIWLDRGYGQPR